MQPEFAQLNDKYQQVVIVMYAHGVWAADSRHLHAMHRRTANGGA